MGRFIRLNHGLGFRNLLVVEFRVESPSCFGVSP